MIGFVRAVTITLTRERLDLIFANYRLQTIIFIITRVLYTQIVWINVILLYKGV